MRATFCVIVLLLMPCLAGCLSFSVGGRQHPTLANEIRDLKKLRDRGTISADEYEMGKMTLLQTYHEPELEYPAAQLATYPDRKAPHSE